ncbi:dTMP kinase [Lignipirellula cremea]|uniref:Thymidylate kinase n=1 Tax=Lignipirellula cremea TaxID=2528010 RepID=A0A518DYE7_9BACT|nr:dTMP kinase [Lignipirellula cremea]QDU96867.1 Thymidylate kinase [Lignipirellula cremea]
MFISFDGVDGAGKSTQIQLCREWLESSGRQVLVCRDPGSTQLGESLRAIVLESRQTLIARRAEMLLFMAARAQLVEEVIRPALAAGQTVLSDRFLLANVVYQGHAGGLDPQAIRRVGEVAIDNVRPDYTLVLDIDPQHASTRFEREPDRMEAQGLSYLQQVRAGFLREAADDSTITVIDASGSIEQVSRSVQAVLAPLLKSVPGRDRI